jgi:hypothetical protein
LPYFWPITEYRIAKIEVSKNDEVAIMSAIYAATFPPIIVGITKYPPGALKTLWPVRLRIL